MTRSDNELQDPASFLPLSPQDFQVLLLLSDRPLHGYGIVKASKHGSDKALLELGSLYRIISRMTEHGLVESTPIDQPDTKRQRRYYRATELGRQVARAEALRLRSLLTSDRAVMLLEDS